MPVVYAFHSGKMVTMVECKWKVLSPPIFGTHSSHRFTRGVSESVGDHDHESVMVGGCQGGCFRGVCNLNPNKREFS